MSQTFGAKVTIQSRSGLWTAGTAFLFAISGTVRAMVVGYRDKAFFKNWIEDLLKE